MKATFKTLTTITGREIRVRENNSKRTFTIVTESCKYRTYPLPKNEVKNCTYNTGNDWAEFLNSSDYYKI